MRYVAKSLNDRTLHLADEPHTRSYCRRLRGDLVVVDADYASERIADRTVTVCAACRTVLEDRRAAERAMEDNFMITDVAERPHARPSVEPARFEAEALPVVDVEAVIAAGVPVVDAPATARAAELQHQADELGAKADRIEEAASAMYGRFAGGQPLLVGHHSYRSAPP